MNNSPEMSVGSEQVKSLKEHTQDVLDSKSPPLNRRADLTRSFLKRNGMDQNYLNKLAQAYEKSPPDINDDKSLTAFVVALQADSGLLDIQQDGIMGKQTKEAIDNYVKMSLDSLSKTEIKSQKMADLKSAEDLDAKSTQEELKRLEAQLAAMPPEDLSKVFSNDSS
ncbi:hypothetical protein COU74_00070 [Candidatus Peregrinibacteria bacterium CG10_big_fil_rev_8_21_14_0_10_36_19]|nr:MAG: hypothetical protein COU74_00070 [Candidatus Peregrinibacteria bacterium CG10_big_fil_rev_8_21_14_0_10_36_19]